MKNVVNVALLKNEKEKRAIHKKIHNIFHNNWVRKFVLVFI